MVRIALDAGHGYNTAGKRTPDGEREWSFNNAVILATIERLNTFAGVEILRLDDPTGVTDIPLKERTNKANAWKADVLVSDHHNASKGVWHGGGGVETFVYPTASQASRDIANAIHKRVVAAMGLRDRGVKNADFHITREAKMPSVLVEGGFMDSTVDIKAMRDVTKLKAQGYAIADGIAEYFALKRKEVAGVTSEPKLTAAQEAVRKKAMELGITDGNNPFREVNQYYVWNAMIPFVERLKTLESKTK